MTGRTMRARPENRYSPGYWLDTSVLLTRQISSTGGIYTTTAATGHTWMTSPSTPRKWKQILCIDTHAHTHKHRWRQTDKHMKAQRDWHAEKWTHRNRHAERLTHRLTHRDWHRERLTCQRNGHTQRQTHRETDAHRDWHTVDTDLLKPHHLQCPQLPGCISGYVVWEITNQLPIQQHAVTLRHGHRERQACGTHPQCM